MAYLAAESGTRTAHGRAARRSLGALVGSGLLMGVMGGLACVPAGTDPTPPPSEPGALNLIAEASPTDATVGDLVRLTGVAASDPQAQSSVEVQYSWVQLSGPGVTLRRVGDGLAEFAAPSLAEASTIGLLLTASAVDGSAVGQAALDVEVAADPDFEDSTGDVAPAPVARAVATATASELADTPLDGSESTGVGLTYRWRQFSGTRVALSNANRQDASFESPEFDEGGNNDLVFELTITDSRGREASDQVTVTVEAATKPRVLVTTSLGNFAMELEDELAPLHTANFLEYVDDGFYTDLIFHRVIDDFVVQGGGFDADLEQQPTLDPVPLEASNGLLNLRATLGAARTNDPDSATSQWYVNLVDNDGLDPENNPPGFTVFGRVIRGFDVVDRIGNQPTQSENGFNDVPVNDIFIRSVERIDR